MKPLPAHSTLAREGRQQLAGKSGPAYWRSLEEWAQTPRFQELLRREFPESYWAVDDGLGRREFLRLMGASLALAGVTAGCTRQPLRDIVPYVHQPPEITPGRPLHFATAMPFRGYAKGMVVTSYEGHPTKVEGNEDHPISLGATDVFMQAALLDLYDPDRAQAVTQGPISRTWAEFLNALNGLMERQKQNHGAGLRLLTETVASPTLQAQLAGLLKAYPEARWHVFDAIDRENELEGARMAFGRRLEAQYDVERAEVIVALDSDFLYTHPAALRHVRQFTNGRRVSGGSSRMNRLYAAEPCPTITGSMAEHRLPVRSSAIGPLAEALQARLSDQARSVGNPNSDAWIEAAAADLKAHHGTSLVIAGDDQPPAVHALALAMNEALGNFGHTITFTEPPANASATLAELASDLEAGKVEALFIFGGNPAFAGPAELDFATRIAKAGFSAHLTVDANETSAACQWLVPETHFLESWSDARAFDGTLSVMQPLVDPLYQGVSAHEFAAALLGQTGLTSYDLVRKQWTGTEEEWREAVHDGVVAGTAWPPVEAKINAQAVSGLKLPAANEAGLEAVFKPDPALWDGRFANNGWLQELGRPIIKVTWENPALISPALAQRLSLENGDIVEARAAGSSIRLPVFATPGVAENSVIFHLGNGRSKVGAVGEGIGSNTYALREAAHLHCGPVELKKTGEQKLIAATQLFHLIDSSERQILREGEITEFARDQNFIRRQVEEPAQTETLYNVGEHAYAGPRWAMSIDLTTCIGCNACVLACQAENNIPVVGKKQVALGRVMQWIRIDSYFRGSPEAPAITHVPVPCMQCENAPCELVCPVGATLHDHEGLNLQVYNRCVGTRFCSNNCPYKVRRFNFLFFAAADYHTPSLGAMMNPEVTVRWRGVMEKCTYCIQRIVAARIQAQEQDRGIRDGEVTPACAQACPARAIVFGDWSDPGSRVSKLKKSPLDYGMLAELNVRPRTTYLAKLRNSNPALKENAHG